MADGKVRDVRVHSRDLRMTSSRNAELVRTTAKGAESQSTMDTSDEIFALNSPYYAYKDACPIPFS